MVGVTRAAYDARVISPVHSKRCTARRRLVVGLTHAPGLWLLYGEPLPRRLRLRNVAAVLATVLAVAVAVAVTHGTTRPIAGVAVWLAGHVAWGAYVAWRLPAYDHESHRRSRAPALRIRALQCDAACQPRTPGGGADDRPLPTETMRHG